MLADLANRFRLLAGRVPVIVLEVINEHESEVRDLIQKQLSQSKRGDGQSITPVYSNPYAKKKGKTNPDLKLTGEYWENIKTQIAGLTLRIISERKNKGFDVAEHLEKRYTTEILNLTQESMNALMVIIMPDINLRFKNELKL